MRVDAFDFELPDDNIALRPASPRNSARLLHVGAQTPSNSGLVDRTIADLPGLLRPGDVLVLNDTSVIAAQLTGERRRDEAAGFMAVPVSVTLIEHIEAGQWWAFCKPGRRLRAGDRLLFPDPRRNTEGLTAQVLDKAQDGRVRLDFAIGRDRLDPILAQIGKPPLPPYIASRRAADDSDRTDYQTMFARHEGAVAAPTAGLHFTQSLMAALTARGIGTACLTLHVGPGTFLPVKVSDTKEHIMHAETGVIDAATADRLNAVRAAGGRIVAVGTTSLRLLESAADADGRIKPFAGETDIFITPGYRFRAVDVLMTNFHLPKSTLFMLVSAFSGLEVMQAAYAHAIATGYRFYSYGDACLLMKHPNS
ncbi:MAG: tRNA preQ1(34) S-adenosylmethionine ribosyltransferase-isomerase QueA [Alphaproteobacteria bacterium]